MDQNAGTDHLEVSKFLKTWGFWAVITGAVAMLLVFVQIAGPSFEAKPSIGTQIGEIAGDMSRSAWRSFFGLPAPAPEPAGFSLYQFTGIAVPVLGVLGIVLSVISGVKKENWHYPVYGTFLGAGAIVFHLFWWVALLVLGVILLVSIIENIGDIFSFGG